MNTVTAVTLSNAQPRLGISSKIYSVAVALLPVLATYASGIPGFSLADVVLVLFTVYAIFRPDLYNENKFVLSPAMLIVGLALIAFFDLFALAKSTEFLFETAIRTIRYGFYVFCFLITSKRLLNVDLLKTAVKLVSLFATGYIFIQYAVYHLLGIILKGFVSFIPLYVEVYADRDYNSLFATMFRPTSFFLEPAHFSRYVLIGLVLFLWSRSLGYREILASIFISIGVLISTSSQGYVLLALVWLCFALSRANRIKRNSLRILGVFCVLISPALLYLLLQLPFVQSTLLRSLSGSLSDSNTAIGARLGGYASFLTLTTYNKIFGMGFGVVPTTQWLSSAAYWLYGGGAILFAVYFFTHIRAVFKLHSLRKMVMILMFLLFFVDDSFYSYMCVIFYSLALLAPVEKKEEVANETDPVLSNQLAIG